MTHVDKGRDKLKGIPSATPSKSPSSKLLKITKIMGVINLALAGIVTALVSTKEAPGPGNLGYCKVPSKEAAEETVNLSKELRKSEYSKIFDRYHSLRNVRNTLAEMKLQPKGKEQLSGYQVLIDLLVHQYDLNIPYTELKKRIELYFENFENVQPSDQLYLLRVAQALWTEKEHKLPWSLKDYNEYEIETLLYEPIFHGGCPPHYPSVDRDYPGEIFAITQVEIDATYQLSQLARNIARKYPGESRERITKEITRWVKSQFFHAYRDPRKNEEYGWNNYGDGRTKNDPSAVSQYSKDTYLFEPKNLERLIEERISGLPSCGARFKKYSSSFEHSCF